MEPELTIWAVTAVKQLNNLPDKPIIKWKVNDFTFDVHLLHDTLWVLVSRNKEARAAYRTAFSPDGLTLEQVKEGDGDVLIKLNSALGQFNVNIALQGSEKIYCITR
jgi:hypothetical protein